MRKNYLELSFKSNDELMVDNIYVNVFIQRDYHSLIGPKFITIGE
jgi:hypothetical protein